MLIESRASDDRQFNKVEQSTQEVNSKHDDEDDDDKADELRKERRREARLEAKRQEEAAASMNSARFVCSSLEARLGLQRGRLFLAKWRRRALYGCWKVYGL